LAAKEKGKIVSASPDSPTLEKLSTFSQQIRSALHCFSAVATRTNALWQRLINHPPRCPKLVATRTNALWQRVTAFTPEGVVASQPARMRCGKAPSQKGAACWSRSQPFANALRQSLHVKPSACVSAVATRTNALWQSKKDVHQQQLRVVATRTNALWQSRAIVVPEPETPKA
jgi:hypothetical protein